MTDTTNKLKGEEDSEKAEGKPEKAKRKKKKSGSWLGRLLHDERLPKVFGLLFLLSSIYLFVAFVSYIFTWKQDQDKVFQFTWNNFLSSEAPIENYLGRLGAYVSHFFIYNGFGISSFIFVGLFFMWGLNLLLRRRVFLVARFTKYSVFALVLIPATLSFVFHNSAFAFGGSVGNLISNWLVAFLGMIGTASLLIFTVLTYLVVAYNVGFNFVNPFRRKAEVPAEEELPAQSGHTTIPVFDSIESIINDGAEVSPANEIPLTVAENPRPLDMNVLESAEEDMTDEALDADQEDELIEEQSTEAEAETSEDLPLETALTDNPSGIEFDITETKEEELIDSDQLVHDNYDPTIDLPDYQYPTLDLLENYGSEKIKIDSEELMRNKDQIINTLQNYGIAIQSIKATVGPTVTLYEIVPAPGIRISKIKNLEDDIALSLAALGIRIIAPIPGKGTIGIEVPNVHKETVAMRTMLSSEKFQTAQMDLPIALGKTIANEIFIADLTKMPHLLMAGSTGQGKSVGVNSILISLLYKKHPSQIKFVLIDPKKVELSLYQTIEKHFLAKLPGEEEPIVVDTRKVVHTLKALTIEMEARYDLLKDAQCRNIKEYNEKFVNRKLNPTKGHRFLPYIVLVIDEFADLIMTAGKEIETPITRLAQLARAIGIHLIIATQRPSVNIITGTIKANFPARIAFKVTAKVDSRTILDTGGADQLVGRGDMLFSINGDIIRLQCGFVDTPEVERVCEFITHQRGYPDAHLLPEVKDEDAEVSDSFDPNERDELFDEAAHTIVQYQQGSTSLLQRRLKLGYNRAGRLMDQLESAHIVGPSQGSKAREVLIKDDIHLEQYLSSLREKSGIA